METKHTPGSWKFRAVRLEESGPVTALLLETKSPEQPVNDPCVLAVREDWVGWMVKNPRGQANARLIESAPDMLSVLQGLVDALDADTCSANILDMIDGEARAAIARAKGVGGET